MKNTTLTFILIALFTAPAFAQQDAENCKDHPMFTRMPDYLITQCSENFASLDLVIGVESKTQYEEGTRTHLDYAFNFESQHKNPSWLQIVRNYENAIFKLQGKKVFKDNSNATYEIAKDGRETWIMLTFINGTDLEVDGYYLDVLQKEPMKQDISAIDMYAELNTNGSIALYINFETSKSDIKPESVNIIDQISEMLQSNPTLSVSIEGHTDNVGAPASNQVLSETSRASCSCLRLDSANDGRNRSRTLRP